MTTAREPERRWLVVSVEAPPVGEQLLLVEALRRLGAGVIEPQGERLVAYQPPPIDLDAFLFDLAAAIRASTSLRQPSVSWWWQTQEEWAQRWGQLGARRVGERIVVAPTGREPAPRPGELLLRIAPGAAFGTAEHATTRACLQRLEELVEPGSNVADVGTGSGILAIAAAKLGATRVLALEMDGYACTAARENLVLNGVADRVEVRQVKVVPGTLPAEGPFDGISANLDGSVLLPLLESFAAALAPRGWLVLSGVSGGELDAVRAAVAATGMPSIAEEQESGWSTIAYRAS